MGRKKKAQMNTDVLSSSVTEYVAQQDSVKLCVEELLINCDYWSVLCVQYRYLYEQEKSVSALVPELESQIAKKEDIERQLRQQLKALEERLEESRAETEKLQNEADRLRTLLEQTEGRVSVVTDTTSELLETSDEFSLLVRRLWKENSQLRTKLAWVDAQNQRYKRLISRLTGTWYGKILQKLYRLFCKLGFL